MTDKKKKKAKGKDLTQPKLQNAILKFLTKHPKKRYNPKQLRSNLRVSNNKDSVKNALEQLEKDGKVYSPGDFKYRLDRSLLEENGDSRGGRNNGRKSDGKRSSRGDRSRRGNKNDETFTGRMDMTRTGSGYVIIDDLDDDIFVPERRMNGALNGDTVEVKRFAGRGRRRPEGEVTKVIKRVTDHFIGTVEMSKNYAFVIVDHQYMKDDIFVPEKYLNGAEDGNKVVVKVKEWGDDKQGKSPVGKITTVFGDEGTANIEMQAILVNNGFNLTFPEEVIAESEDFREDIEVAEIHRRRDMRDILTFTIDPDDAKDFDDALSYEILENGNRSIGIHIADVTHYVKPGTELDKEAYYRSTSVYLVDRVLPMLPERLSNGLCSLRPHEDKCTFSAIFEFDKKDKIVDRWFGKTITHSDRRFTYNQAQEIIEGEDTDNEDLNSAVRELDRLATKMRKRRFKEGAIDFDADEVKFRLDDNGVPIELYVKERKEAHLLVEDFMLLANREVATFIQDKMKGKAEIPFVYRIHDEPNPDKVAELASFAAQFGLDMKTDSPKEIAEAYNSLRAAARENPELKLLAPIAIRTMAKAVYSTDNIGHYGLGFENYSHFTSPIRRYADVLAHRILEKNLEEKTFRVKKEELEEQCKHISIMERRAVDAERESIKYKQVEYMKNHIGEEFDGQISGIMDRGIFVEVGGGIAEGMAPFEMMEEDYDVAEGRLIATSRQTGKKLRMGQRVRVTIVSANLEKRQIEMDLVGVLDDIFTDTDKKGKSKK